MRVKVFYVNQDTGDETFWTECSLDETLDRADDEYGDAVWHLQDNGRYWLGGGAAPLVLLLRV